MTGLAIFAGVRTPFGRAGGFLKDLYAEDLGALAVRELLLRTGCDAARLDGVTSVTAPACINCCASRLSRLRSAHNWYPK